MRRSSVSPMVRATAAPTASGTQRPCVRAKIHGTYHKRHLPTYDVFDEMRTSVLGRAVELFEIAGVPVGVTICEDSWIPDGPVNQLAHGGARIVVNVNGSPFRVGAAHP